MNIATWALEIVSDLYVAGTDEEGREYTAEAYYLVIENDHGERFAHHHTFPGCDVGYHEGIAYFGDIRVEAKEQAQELFDKIESAGEVDLTHWSRTDPGYGTVAYLDLTRSMTKEQLANY